MNLKEITHNSPSSALDHWFSSDAQFHKLYPDSLHLLSKNHWTALSVARKAANFLAVGNGARILDIGSGIGKFCLAGAYYKPRALYFGVEQRKDLVEYGETARIRLGLDNVSFVHGNFTQVDFENYDHFYFYNSFYENVANAEKIDDSIPYSVELYNYYNYYLYKQLEKMPSGTRVATFYGTEEIMPPGYHIGGSDVDDLLKYWVKE
ncbi:MAG: class I SAM-dependent methyltransferase [Chitinophagaceae bacterium]